MSTPPERPPSTPATGEHPPGSGGHPPAPPVPDDHPPAPPAPPIPGGHPPAPPAPGSGEYPPAPPASGDHPPVPPPPPVSGQRPAVPAPGGPPRPRLSDARRSALVVGAIVAVVGLLAVVLVAVRGGDDGPQQVASDPPSPTTPVDAEAQLQRTVDEVSAFVEEERGLTFGEDVDVELVADEEFDRRVLEDFEEVEGDLRTTQVLFDAFGLIDSDVDLVEAYRSLLGEGVVGFYDPETDELVVRGTEITPYIRQNMAHELTHALDDQHFDLDRPEYDDAPDEVAFGFSALGEGNAVRVERAYTAAMNDEDHAAALAEEQALGAEIDIGDVPTVLLDLVVAPYDYGEGFVDALLDAGGQEALDAAFDEPPRTSEAILDPEAFLERDERLAVEHPDPRGAVLDEYVAGELLIRLILADQLGMSEAQDASSGWGGDWVATWRDGDVSCATMTVVGDSPGETSALRDAFDRWATGHGDASVEGPSGGPFTVQACAG